MAPIEDYTHLFLCAFRVSVKSKFSTVHLYLAQDVVNFKLHSWSQTCNLVEHHTSCFFHLNCYRVCRREKAVWMCANTCARNTRIGSGVLQITTPKGCFGVHVSSTLVRMEWMAMSLIYQSMISNHPYHFHPHWPKIVSHSVNGHPLTPTFAPAFTHTVCTG